MIKYSLCPSQDKLNPLFQQQYLQGRVHARDYAFYMKKLAFMQNKQAGPDKKEQNRNQNNG